MRQVTIIDYGSGNVLSAQKSFIKVTNENNIEAKVIISKNLNDIRNSSHIVLPGQGAFSTCMKGLKNTPGLIEELVNFALVKKKPFWVFVSVCKCLQIIVRKMDCIKGLVGLMVTLKLYPKQILRCHIWVGMLLLQLTTIN